MNNMDCSPPGSSVHGILQAKIQKWADVSFSRDSSQPRDQTWVSCITGRFFIHYVNSCLQMVNLSFMFWNFLELFFVFCFKIFVEPTNAEYAEMESSLCCDKYEFYHAMPLSFSSSITLLSPP